ncbi:putative flavone 3'-O-methyltransferase [Medicago truncatula]|uniref:Caffeoyl-CoA 3-O-methyltransferase n=1 Tax=Medicago truncatula TaxID=3880 RepID=G7KJ71_MEDTR|nr:probable caffeoyl-CoA O-methyltransferase At4g26220 [Medicago truncatula]AES77089.1 caffeoyl-CoA 3-O-methyltransferase [Medicago truncatula]RHN53116.1 putative flavone 3'-O-methyltransferase [Medicago truncatula]
MEHVKDPSIYKNPVILQSEDLTNYILDTAVYPREPEPLKELRKASENHPWGFIATAPEAGQLITLLLKLLNPKKTIEVGVFTGYSLLLTALNIPDDGKITAIDIDRKTYEIGLPVIRKAGVEHKIDYIESPALPILDKLLEDPTNEGTFDFAFIDADKENYLNYHERLIKLVKVGGLLIYDNILWGGRVAWPEEKVPMHSRPQRIAAIEFNKKITDDSRVEFALTSVGDGLSICRRIA